MAADRLEVIRHGVVVADGGEVVGYNSEIGFEDMKEFADGYGFICEKEGRA